MEHGGREDQTEVQGGERTFQEEMADKFEQVQKAQGKILVGGVLVTPVERQRRQIGHIDMD